MDRVDTFIAQLYRLIRVCHTESFRESALRALGAIVAFDGALWGSGNPETGVFHSVVTLGVDSRYPHALETTQDLNPIFPALLRNIGRAVAMRSVIDDAAFRQSDVYCRCFARYGVERVLSYLGHDRDSSVYTLISLYRFDAGRIFTETERRMFQRAAYHMIAAASHAYFVHTAIQNRDRAQPVHAAICDRHGCVYQTQPGFRELVARAFPGWRGDHLPFALPGPGEQWTAGGLSIECEAVGDLYCLRAWALRPTDRLEARDRRIVEGICRGMTFKDIAREMNLAPSTVSNRLYRVYRQLGVANRSALVRLVNG